MFPKNEHSVAKTYQTDPRGEKNPVHGVQYTLSVLLWADQYTPSWLLQSFLPLCAVSVCISTLNPLQPLPIADRV